MADSKVLEILNSGVDRWNNLMEGDSNFLWYDLSDTDLTTLDLTGIKFYKAILNGAVLSGGRLSGAHFLESNLSGATLIGANLAGTILSNVNFIGADLSGTEMAGAELFHVNWIEIESFLSKRKVILSFKLNPFTPSRSKTNLSDSVPAIQFHKTMTAANLSGANLTGAQLSYVNLNGANLAGANLSDAKLVNVNLYKTILSDANFSNADLTSTDLTSVNLSGVNMSGAKLSKVDLHNTVLSGVNLSNAKLAGANLTGVDLTHVDLSNADLSGADLSGADLSDAVLFNTNLTNANLTNAVLIRANLSGANLTFANLSGASLSGANLSGADLSKAVLVDTDLSRALLERTRIYGISAWGVRKEGIIQKDLLITKEGEPEITVDNLEVAQFIYLMLNNQNIRDVIDTVTSKAVLILGRFTDERKPILDALKDELRNRNYLPILFDFEGPKSRDLTETISILANMSRFVIADLTEPQSIPQEITSIVPHMPSLPVLPIIMEGKSVYSMFEHLARYPWVMPLYHYPTPEAMVYNIVNVIIEPAEQKAKEMKPPLR